MRSALRARSASVRPASTAGRAMGKLRRRWIIPLWRSWASPIEVVTHPIKDSLDENGGSDVVDVAAPRYVDGSAEHVADHRGLARAVGAEQPKHRTCLGGQVDSSESLCRTEALGNARGFDDRTRRCSFVYLAIKDRHMDQDVLGIPAPGRPKGSSSREGEPLLGSGLSVIRAFRARPFGPIEAGLEAARMTVQRRPDTRAQDMTRFL